MAKPTGLRPKPPRPELLSNRLFFSCCPETDISDSASPPQPPQHPLLPLGTAVTVTPPRPPRPGTSGPLTTPPVPQASLRAFGFLCCSPLLPSHPHPESDTKESGSWARAQGQSDQPDLPPSRHRAQDGEARRARAGLRGWAREFSMNLFFFRLRSFGSPVPQKSCHLPRLRHQLFPLPPLLLAITLGDLTPSAPLAPLLPWTLGGPT